MTPHPRIRHLPEEERAPFQKWITPQTRPVIPDVPDCDQDAYYDHDYRRWKMEQETGIQCPD